MGTLGAESTFSAPAMFAVGHVLLCPSENCNLMTTYLCLTIVYIVYYLFRPHMIINCVNVVIILFCLGVKIIFTIFHFLTDVCLV